MPTFVWVAAAGIILGAGYAASPVFVLTLVGSAGLLAVAGRDLRDDERRRLLAILGLALGVRFVLIGVLLVSNLPHLSDLAVGGLRGDDAYYLGRAIRARDVMLDLTRGRYDYFVISDEYGRTSYLHFLTLLQVWFGPTPYGVRALNSLLFVTGAYLMFRICRPGLGATASISGLAVLLFLPSLLVSSMSTAKEPSYFFVTGLLLTAALAVVRAPDTATKIGAVIVAALCLWTLDDLRRGALVLSAAGLALAFLSRLVLATPRRAAISIVAIVLVAAGAWTQQPIRDRVLAGTASAAKMHAGHVFTSGHAYKLLDEGFYMHPGTPAAWALELTEAQAARFWVRAATSFVVTPLPWEMASLSELVFFPEHVLWLLMMLFLPIGAIVGWRRDPAITALLLGFALPTAAVLAATTGNVGTLLRLRGLVTPFGLWFAVLGALAVGEWVLTRSKAPALKPIEAVS